nr:RteC domain-containing protein [Bacteroides timonensis]
MDRQVSAIDLNGRNIIEDCKTITVFLREQLAKLKVVVQTTPFGGEAEEIAFFKDYKPMLLGRLIYFHEILRIESRRPLGDDTLDEYYEKNRRSRNCSSTVMWRFSSIIAVRRPTWIITISCAENGRRTSSA